MGGREKRGAEEEMMRGSGEDGRKGGEEQRKK